MRRVRKASGAHATFCLLALGLLQACSSTPPPGGSGAVVRVVVDANATSKCVRVMLLPNDSVQVTSGAVEIGSSRQAEVAFARGALPERVMVFAIGYADAQCTMAAVPVERTEEDEIIFTEGKTRTYVITLTRRDNAQDADADGYVSVATGGTDCDDNDSAVHPGTAEVCGNQKDDNCDKASDCADSACMGATCGVGAACAAQACRETACGDGEDNDVDGEGDCSDIDCASQPCAGGGTCQMSVCRSANTELGNCADGQDNDGDQLKDCADPDCANQACAPNDKCVTGARCQSDNSCGGGMPLQCPLPANGCLNPGTCQSTTGQCTYPPKTGSVCDDGLKCTTDDTCSSRGTCTGTAMSCNMPPSCFMGAQACSETLGCVYTPAVGSVCGDGQSCTTSDQCQADGGCGGTQVACNPGACQSYQGQCEMDGGCVFASESPGSACDGGVCNAMGSCIGGFAYTPGNFALSAMPTPSVQATVLDCTQVIIDVPSQGLAAFTRWCAGQPLPGAAEVTLANGTTAVLLSFNSLTVGPNTQVLVRGARPVIFASLGQITISGRVLASSGAKGCSTGAGKPGQHAFSNGGGGGGAFGSEGGHGGRGVKGNGMSDPGEGGPGGTPEGMLSLVPLRGGCPGGMGGGSSSRAAPGGGGIQFSAAGDVIIGGVIAAAGEGGLGGTKANPGRGGNGGGSGGGILIEGQFVTLVGNGAVTVNGGGGGEGGGTLTMSENGAEGSIDTDDPAKGGEGALAGGAGGDGAAKSDATNGADAPSGVTNTAGGGGGGGVGRIRLNSVNGCSVGPAVVLGRTVTSNKNGTAGCP